MNRKPISLLVVLLFLLSSCSGQDKNKFDEKSQHPSIRVITDPQEVAALRKSMEENIRERNKAAASKKKAWRRLIKAATRP